MQRLRENAARGNRERGSSLVEFALVGTFMFVPILAGLVTVGIALVVAQQVQNFNGNAGQMFAAGTDFTQAGNVAILEKLSGSLDLTGSGYALVILSEIDGDANTPNKCVSQLPLGAGTGASRYCTAVGSSATSAFAALSLGISTDSSGNSVSTGTLQLGQKSFVAETFYNNPLYAWTGGSSSGIYSFAVF